MNISTGYFSNSTTVVQLYLAPLHFFFNTLDSDPKEHDEVQRLWYLMSLKIYRHTVL